MSTQAAPPQAGNGDVPPRAIAIDWVAAERSPEFRKLVRAKRSSCSRRCIFFFAWYFGFILLAGYAESFMGESIYQGFTVGYALALSQFVMVWALGAWYVRKASREWDPLAERARERALSAAPRERSRCTARRARWASRVPGPPVSARRCADDLLRGSQQHRAGARSGSSSRSRCCITYWASKRTKTATDFWAAGRGITAAQNGLAIAGDYMSAASFWESAG